MTTGPFDFESFNGHLLSGRLEEPDGAPRAWAVFAHCFTCGKDSRAAILIARALAVRGISVLRFDFAGLGTSEGAFADTTFAANVEDIVAAARAMSENGREPALLIGHSLGGTAVLAAAGAISGVRAVATIGSPFEVTHILHHFAPDSLAEIERDGESEVSLAGRPFRLKKPFIDDLGRHDMAARVAALHRPLLVMHAPGDTTVGIDNAAKIFGAAKHPKSFISLDDADHLLTRRADADYAAQMISAWAARYLPAQDVVAM